MSDRIVINDPFLGEELAQIAGTSFNPRRTQTIARVKDGKLLGGVLYSNYTGESIAGHSASIDPHWINRDIMFVAFDYPFNQLGVKRIFGQVPETNTHAIEFNRKMGFRVIARIEGVYRHDVACIVMRMDREDCRLLSIKPKNIKSNRH